MEACAEEMSSADLNDQKSAGRWLGIKRSIKSTMKTWQVDITANHSFPQKKEGVFGVNRYKTPTGVRQMLSVGKILFEPTSLKWWWGVQIYQKSIGQQIDKWSEKKESKSNLNQQADIILISTVIFFCRE